jgi:hypothetical protein
MSSAPETPQQTSLLQKMANEPQVFGRGFLVAAVVIAGLTIGAAGWWLPERMVPIIAAGVTLTITFLAAGLERLFHQPKPGTELDVARLLLLAIGGLTGWAITKAGLLLGWTWWDNILNWLNAEGPGEKSWRGLVVLLLIVLGLGIMFVSLQLGRTDERSNAVVRRLLYGYNTALAGLLLIAILLVLNVILAVRGKIPIDFTRAGRFSLSERTQNVLKGLNKPVEIISVSGNRDELVEQDVRDMLAMCRLYSDKVRIDEVNVHLERNRALELKQKYPKLEPGCLVVLYGKDEAHEVIPVEELSKPSSRGGPRNPMGPGPQDFTGEDVLLTTLISLIEGKQKSIVYFTQDFSELSLADSNANSQFERGCGLLKTELEKQNYEVKPLKFDLIEPKVPTDASVVVVAGPRVPFSSGAVKALRDYMGKGGKLLIMLGAFPDGEDKNALVRSGLEPFLQEHSVGAPRERLLTFKIKYNVEPLDVIAVVNDQLETNPVVVAFQNRLFKFNSCRPLEAAPPMGAGRWQAQPLMLSDSFSFPQTDLAVAPSAVVDELRRDQDVFRKKIEEIQKRGPIPLVVAVNESTMNPNDPHAAMRGPQPGKPRMVVFGTVSLAANQTVSQNRASALLIAGCLDYLRERKAGLSAVPPKQQDYYEPQPKTDDQMRRMIWLPPILIVVSILGLGTGVWIVRRR